MILNQLLQNIQKRIREAKKVSCNSSLYRDTKKVSIV